MGHHADAPDWATIQTDKDQQARTAACPLCPWTHTPTATLLGRPTPHDPQQAGAALDVHLRTHNPAEWLAALAEAHRERRHILDALQAALDAGVPARDFLTVARAVTHLTLQGDRP